MDIATESVTVRRDTKTATLSLDMLRALALTAVKNAIDPQGTAKFDSSAATANADGSISVSVALETVVPEAAAVSQPAAPANPQAASFSIV